MIQKAGSPAPAGARQRLEQAAQVPRIPKATARALGGQAAPFPPPFAVRAASRLAPAPLNVDGYARCQKCKLDPYLNFSLTR